MFSPVCDSLTQIQKTKAALSVSKEKLLEAVLLFL